MAKLDNSSKNDSLGFFSKLISSLFRSSDPEAEKKRRLKSIAKILSKSKYKFYKFSSDEALPALGKFFHDIYKTVGPAQIMFNNIKNPAALKNAAVTFSISKNQLELVEKLDEAYILELAKKISLSEVSQQIKNNLSAFTEEFDITKMNNIDNLYSKTIAFKNFCTFDFYFLLKKFDSALHENDFNYSPHFDSIRSEYILDDLKDFITVAWALPLDENWKDVMALLKQIRGIEPIAIANWTKILNRLRDLKRSSVLEMIIQLISKDPSYTHVVNVPKESICESYLEKLRSSAENTLRSIEKEKTNSKIDEILNYLFGTTSVVRLRNYTDNQNVTFQKKGLSGYLHSQPLNYMKAFLIDFFKKDVREFADIVLVRGKWTTSTMANQFSDIYHSILAISDQITEFDDTFAEDKELGMKIKTLILRCDKDRDTGRIIRSVLKDANDKAMEILTNGSQLLVSFGRSVKNLLADHEKPHAEMIINWKELDRHTDEPIKDCGVKIYKMIYQFITLMQFYLKKREE